MKSKEKLKYTTLHSKTDIVGLGRDVIPAEGSNRTML